MVKQLRIKCNNHLKGCSWIGEMRLLQGHLNQCDFMTVPCPNNCKDYSGKVLLVLRKESVNHLNNECPRRQFKCPHCTIIGEHHVITSQHINECPNVTVSCPNNDCEKRLLRNLVTTHLLRECLFQTASCKYANIGCEVRLHRINLLEHEKDESEHFKLATETVYKQQETLRELQSSLSSAIVRLSKLEQAQQTVKGGRNHQLPRQEPATFSLKLINFHKHKVNSSAVHTSPIYTSPGGYKMCFRVDANGNGFGSNSHVSVFAFLMRGENDDLLPWPFSGKIEIIMLNQLRDKNHCKDVIDFSDLDESSKVPQRVMHSERAPTGYGIYTFVPFSALHYDSGKKCQYLKDDCLYFEFRVYTNNTPDSKPWLNPSVIPLHCTIDAD